MKIQHVLLFVTVLATANVHAQIVGKPKGGCTWHSATLTVTVTDVGGAVIPNAFVMLRGDSSPAKSDKPFQLELRTDATGKATATVECGYLDIFATAGGFTPFADKVLIDQNKKLISVPLKVHPMVMY